MDSNHSVLHPTQSFFLIRPNRSTLEDLYKYIIWDLYARGVIDFVVRIYQAHHRDKRITKAWHVVTGNSFADYEPRDYETPVIRQFINKPEAAIRFSLWARNLYRSSKPSGHFKRKLIKSSHNVEGLFAKNALAQLNPLQYLNPTGRLFARHLRFYVKEFDRKISEGYLSTHPAEAKDHLINLRTNVFLLSEASLKAFAKYRKEHREKPFVWETSSQPDGEIYREFLFGEKFDFFWDNHTYFDRLFESHFAPGKGVVKDSVAIGRMGYVT